MSEERKQRYPDMPSEHGNEKSQDRGTETEADHTVNHEPSEKQTIKVEVRDSHQDAQTEQPNQPEPPDSSPIEGEVVSADPPENKSGDPPPEQPQAQATDYKDQWLRAVADFKNYKRRAEAEREDLKRNASAGLILKLLPILDDLELALNNVPDEVAQTSWWEGTRMIAQKFSLLLESEGVVPIEAVGQEFDPNLHHAVTFEENAEQADKVVAELQKGYKMHDRVLRPAMVKVGKS